MNENQITVGHLLSAVWRHKIKCAGVAVLTMAMVIAFWIFAPRDYGSEGRLFIPMGRADTALSYTEGSMPVSVQNARETKIRSVMELIKSHEVLARVANDPEITTAAILDSPFDFLMESLPKISGERSEKDSAAIDVQKAVKKMLSNLKVDMEKNTEVVSIYMKAQSPELAKKIVDKIMDETAVAYLDVHKQTDTVAALEKSTAEKRQVVRDLKKKYSEFKNGIRLNSNTDTPFSSIESARNTLETIIGSLKTQKVNLELDRVQSEEEVARLDAELTAIGQVVEVPKEGVERRSTENAQSQVFGLKSELASLTAKYTTHPRIDIIREQLKSMEQDFDELPDRTEMVTVSNPAFEDVRVDRARAETKAKSIAVRLNRVNELLVVAEKDVKQLNLIELESEDLRMEMQVAQKYFDASVKTLGDALSMKGLDEMNVSDLKIQQAGTYWPKHVSPRGSIILPIGMLLSMGLALLTALIADRSSSVISHQDNELEETLDLPVLITLPRVASRRAMLR